MKGILFYFVLFALIGSGCNQKSEKMEETEAVSEVPPSISKKKAVNKMVKLSDREIQELDIEHVEVAREIQDYITVAPGKVFPAPDHISIISAPLDGRITAINAFEGEQVQQGEILFSMESLTFGNLVAEYLQAVAEKDYQQNRLERISQLVEKKISSESELDRARSDFKRASASVSAAYSRLRAVGVPGYEIEDFAKQDNINPVLNIRVPIDGIIDRRMVEAGQSVNAYDKMARIIDKTHVLIKGYVSPQDGQYLKVGDSVNITLRNTDKWMMQGMINSINPGLDEENRSVVVNIIVPTQDEWPKPGENVKLEIHTSSPMEVVAIPLEALTYDGNTPIVFVKKDQRTYEQRPLQLNDIRDKYAFVTAGLDKGEQIAITQVFSLKALARYEQFSE